MGGENENLYMWRFRQVRIKNSGLIFPPTNCEGEINQASELKKQFYFFLINLIKILLKVSNFI
jgi:hypothetical protein